MILAFEMNSMGTHHAPGNSATLQTFAHAVPEQKIRMHAHATHLAELRADPLLADDARIEFAEIAISPHYRTKAQVVSVRRFWRELMTLFAALRRAPRGEYCLVLLLSTTSTAILAASLLAMTGLRRMGVAVCLHGDVVTLTGWRSRNPVIRRLDLRAMLAAPQPRPVRFLVLEECIKRELSRLVPRSFAVTDVLPLPTNLAEVAYCRDLPLQYPVRIGLVGQATEAKGITPFLETARLFKQQYGERVEFYLVGRVFPGDDTARFASLDAPVSTTDLARDDFRDLLGRLHFVFLPLQPQYYSLAASGALLDAITWLKPVIATSVPIVSDFFVRFGDIGYLCNSTAEMQQALHTVLTDMDPVRYAHQVEAMRRVREARLPANLALHLRGVIQAHFPELVIDAS